MISTVFLDPWVKSFNLVFCLCASIWSTTTPDSVCTTVSACVTPIVTRHLSPGTTHGTSAHLAHFSTLQHTSTFKISLHITTWYYMISHWYRQYSLRCKRKENQKSKSCAGFKRCGIVRLRRTSDVIAKFSTAQSGQCQATGSPGRVFTFTATATCRGVN